MKILIDTAAKTTTYLDAGTATTVDPIKETVTVPLAQFTSELGQVFGNAPTPDDKNAWWNKAPTGSPSVREQINLTNGMQVPPMKVGAPGRKVSELNWTNPCEVGLHVELEAGTTAKTIGIDLAGLPSGEVNGAVGLSVGGRVLVAGGGSGPLQSLRAGPFKVGSDIQPGETIDVTLKVASGDKKIEFVVFAQ